MKKQIYLWALAVVALLGTACEKVIEFKGEIAEPRLTVSAQAVAGDPFPVYVASSVFFLQSNHSGEAFTEKLDTLRGAVRCYVNGARESKRMVLDPDASYSSLCYVAEDYVPGPGDHIRLEVEFPGFDPVWAETDVPLVPQFEILSTDWTLMEKSWEGEQDYYQVDMTLALTDDGTYDKYYCLQPIQGYFFEPGQMVFVEVIPFKSNDIIFQQLDVSAFQRFDFRTGEPWRSAILPTACSRASATSSRSRCRGSLLRKSSGSSASGCPRSTKACIGSICPSPSRSTSIRSSRRASRSTATCMAATACCAPLHRAG